jgi:hypothetical protein
VVVGYGRYDRTCMTCRWGEKVESTGVFLRCGNVKGPHAGDNVWHLSRLGCWDARCADCGVSKGTCACGGTTGTTCSIRKSL